MAKADEEALSELLYSTGILLPVRSSSKGGRVDCICRTANGMDKEWPSLAEKLLRAGEEASVEVHACRRYLLKDGVMAYGIHVSVESASAKKLKMSLDILASTLGEAKTLGQTEKAAPAVPKMSYSEYKKQTKATPRAPMPEAPRQPPPPNFSYQTKRIREEVSGGKVVVIDEIPIPHVHHEMNVPNSKGRGAKYT